MILIDHATVEVRSGKGGDGAIAFRREKYVPKGGPAGGNGGKGASVIFRASSGVNTLYNFRFSKVFIGPDGEKGGIKNQYGKASQDIYVDVPIGTVVYLEEGHKFLGDLDYEGKTLLVAKGGRGGRGNTCFKSPTNRVPRIAENGEPGERHRLILELKLLADVGLVGLPSVGKSTLLSLVSNARPEIADYPFTTTSPNLGLVSIGEESFVMADLPGLIEGAHLGKGLGLDFLKHVERCRIIIHVVDMSDNGRDAYEDYQTINNELKEYGLGLDKRPVILVASKMDEDGAKEKLKAFKKKVKEEIFEISAYTDEGLKPLLYKCIELLKVTPKFPLVDAEEKDIDTKVYTLEEEEKEFYIVKEKAHLYRILGDRIIKYYRMTNISTDEGLMKLLAHLRKIGVDNELERMGAEDGDEVILDDFTFDYYN